MGFFTDSPYEYMMSQRPYTGGRGAGTQPAPLPVHPCGGCPYGTGSTCIGVCMKELLKKRQDKKGVEKGVEFSGVEQAGKTHP